MKKRTKLLSMLMTIVSVFTLSFAMVGCSSSKAVETEKVEQSALTENDFKTEFISTKNVKLMATPMALAGNSNYVEQTLTATVYPSTATNKLVDWSVAWGDSSNTTDVTDYVEVTPLSDGSTTAKVKCYKPFTGDVVVTVTTRESGYTAEVLATFVGIPSDIIVAGTVSENSEGYYYVGGGQTYSFTYNMTNIFNQVGADYSDVNVTLGAVGSVVLGYMEKYTSSGNTKWFDEENETHTLDSLKDNFITVSASNGTLTITTIKTIESYCGSTQKMDGGRTFAYRNKFRSYADECYFTITLTQPDTGITKVMKIKFDDTVVTGIEASNTQIFF